MGVAIILALIVNLVMLTVNLATGRYWFSLVSVAGCLLCIKAAAHTYRQILNQRKQNPWL